ncbi:hypothetical protein SAMD00019534_006310 [Acytostelium subglobosum LB1]|uniref:hypothetical protein n=1 Tax=Acytostelium subglobosum LB1 TaxID=1410327 RepID=UPI000644881B|nr:hypothetical protein SAMD00019534_006310 [Acytostelium subglobosum LB1]GAM17456.1 hypothetical protein SAMD00019534_006310 [Acytostelium subglobosum LB1]|eukprot:XP_012759518.1 hypothetical protein SAMD00019534_006310 [Acytostelium subglobosum LB1]
MSNNNSSSSSEINTTTTTTAVGGGGGTFKRVSIKTSGDQTPVLQQTPDTVSTSGQQTASSSTMGDSGSNNNNNNNNERSARRVTFGVNRNSFGNGNVSAPTSPNEKTMATGTGTSTEVDNGNVSAPTSPNEKSPPTATSNSSSDVKDELSGMESFPMRSRSARAKTMLPSQMFFGKPKAYIAKPSQSRGGVLVGNKLKGDTEQLVDLSEIKAAAAASPEDQFEKINLDSNSAPSTPEKAKVEPSPQASPQAKEDDDDDDDEDIKPTASWASVMQKTKNQRSSVRGSGMGFGGFGGGTGSPTKNTATPSNNNTGGTPHW